MDDLIQNDRLGNCLICYDLAAIEKESKAQEISFRYDDERVFPGHSALQLEKHGLIEQKEDQCYLTEKGLKALKEILSAMDTSLRILTGDNLIIPDKYLN